MPPKRIFLVGPMGAGKSTIGRKLASDLGWPFIDSDHEIERITGVDIPYIFDKEGEAGFRQREAQVIADLVAEEPIVLATGGGAVVTKANRDALSRNGLVVYLRTSVEQSLRRTAHDAGRPLLHVDDREKKLRELAAAREPLYNEVADLTLSTDRNNANLLCQQIIAHVQSFSLGKDV